jgi:TolB-like protein
MRVGIRPPKSICVALTLLLAIGLTAPVSAQQRTPAPAASGKELIAVLDLEAIGSSKTEASAMTDRLREELLRTGKFALVDRAQIDTILKEQAFQQTGCTSAECAVQVGKLLGARKLVTGRVTKIDDEHWLLSAQIIDVETGETLRSESFPHEGKYFTMLVTGIATLAAKLAADQAASRPGPAVPPAAPTAVAAAPLPPAQPVPAQKPAEKKGMSGWWWVLIGVFVVGAAAAASSTKKSSSSSTSSSSGSASSCTSNCSTVGFSW